VGVLRRPQRPVLDARRLVRTIASGVVPWPRTRCIRCAAVELWTCVTSSRSHRGCVMVMLPPLLPIRWAQINRATKTAKSSCVALTTLPGGVGWQHGPGSHQPEGQCARRLHRKVQDGAPERAADSAVGFRPCESNLTW
jgi:hypothetical protein